MRTGEKHAPETREAIAASRRGRKWSSKVRRAIGAGVRKGAANKVPFNTRIDPKVAASFRAKAKAKGLALSITTEKAFTDFS